MCEYKQGKQRYHIDGKHNPLLEKCHQIQCRQCERNQIEYLRIGFLCNKSYCSSKSKNGEKIQISVHFGKYPVIREIYREKQQDYHYQDKHDIPGPQKEPRAVISETCLILHLV